MIGHRSHLDSALSDTLMEIEIKLSWCSVRLQPFLRRRLLPLLRLRLPRLRLRLPLLLLLLPRLWLQLPLLRLLLPRLWLLLPVLRLLLPLWLLLPVLRHRPPTAAFMIHREQGAGLRDVLRVAPAASCTEMTPVHAFSLSLFHFSLSQQPVAGSSATGPRESRASRCETECTA